MIGLSGLIMVLTACGQDTEQKDHIIYTSIYPIQYIVEHIGGDHITAESIYPPGVDAHSYEPSTREMTQISRGEAFIYLGAGMESFAETAADSLNNQDVELIEIATLDESLFSADNHSDEEHGDHDYGDKDPHIWFDPIKMIQMGELIKEELAKIFPDEKDTFESNFESFASAMDNLDDEYSQVLEAKDNKKILVAHAAYGYLEERYGLEQIAISGLTTNDEPSQKDLTQIVKMAQEYDLNYVMFEQTGTDRVSDIIREQIHAEPLYLHNLESLTEEDIENGDDYVSLMLKNLDAFNQATY